MRILIFIYFTFILFYISTGQRDKLKQPIYPLTHNLLSGNAVSKLHAINSNLQ